ncbi:MAG: diguanylate cyclase [Gallionella sp.]|nr:diguanylate cyclase [Gallionella sp.]
MKLKTRIFILMSVIFAAFMVTIALYSSYLVTQLNEHWGARVTEKQVLFDKHRTLQPLLREIGLARQLAAEPAMLEMALHEGSVKAQEAGIGVLEQYRMRFQDHSYFAAIIKSGHYYFNDDDAKQFGAQQLRYTLSRKNPDDAWFYATVESDHEYQVNVDPDAHLGNVKVWINVAVKQGNRVVAVIGTGIDIGEFLKGTVDDTQVGIDNLFIDRDMAVQLHADQTLIDYASLTKAVDQRRKVDVLLRDPSDLAKLRAVMHRLESAPDKIETLWVNYEGRKRLLGVAYLPAIGWFDLTLIDGGSLGLLEQFYFIPVFAALFLLGLLATGIILHRLVLKPLYKMGLSIEQIKSGNYDIDVPQTGTGEIAELSAEFKNMLDVVRNTKHELENTVAHRTAQLSLELAERRRAEDDLRRSETKFRQLFELSPIGLAMVDHETGKFLEVNHSVLESIGYSKAELLALNCRDVTPAEYEFQEREQTDSLNRTGYFGPTIREYMRKDGSRYPIEIRGFRLTDSDGKMVVWAIVEDITERTQLEAQIRQLAYYDTLTQLPNRRLLNDRMNQVIASSRRSGCHAALMFLDLDNFKPLNDTYGHAVGDLLLVEAATRLKNCVREMDTVARFGGDEFVVMLSELDRDQAGSAAEALNVAEKIRSVLSQSYSLMISREERVDTLVEHHCTVSIGVVLFADYEGSQDEVLKWADAAMYQAKEDGRNQIRFYEAPV